MTKSHIHEGYLGFLCGTSSPYLKSRGNPYHNFGFIQSQSMISPGTSQRGCHFSFLEWRGEYSNIIPTGVGGLNYYILPNPFKEHIRKPWEDYKEPQPIKPQEEGEY